MPARSESHAYPNLGVTMRGKESLVLTESRIVVFQDEEVKTSSSYESKVSKSTPIFSNRTLSDYVVCDVDFIQGNQSNMQ